MKHRFKLFLMGGLILFSLYLLLTYLPLSPFNQKPLPKPYDYYEILDEETHESLMNIPIVVNVGDELLTEDNRRFVIVKVVNNTAYARPKQP